MIEAFNKTLKYRHLFPHAVTDYESLVKHLGKCIPEYNTIRPHCAYKFLTPTQVYFGKDIDLEKLKNHRRRLGLSQKKLAAMLEIDPSTLSGWEFGKHRPMKKSRNLIDGFLGSR